MRWNGLSGRSGLSNLIFVGGLEEEVVKNRVSNYGISFTKFTSLKMFTIFGYDNLLDNILTIGQINY